MEEDAAKVTGRFLFISVGKLIEIKILAPNNVKEQNTKIIDSKSGKLSSSPYEGMVPVPFMQRR